MDKGECSWYPSAPRIRHRQFDLEVRRVVVIRGRKRCCGDVGETLKRMRMTVRGTMVQDNVPRKCGSRKRTFVRIGGMAGKCNRLADFPLGSRSRRINKRRGLTVSSCNGYLIRAGCP